jgi:signal transduction histidine kinase
MGSRCAGRYAISEVRFRQQLAIGYSALLVILLVTGAAGVIAVRVTKTRLEHVAHDLGSDLSAIQRMRYQTESAIAASRRFLLTGDSAAEAQFAQAVTRLDTTLAELDSDGDELVPGMQAVHVIVRRYVDMARDAMAARDPLLESKVAPVREQLEATIADFVARERAACDAESAHAGQMADRMEGIVVIATAAAAAVSIALALLWMRKLDQRYAFERRATEAARAAVASRDEMLAIVSHDLRNPLTTIEIGAGMVQTDAAATPTTVRHAGMMADAARRMEHLIGELLDVAKLDAGRLELAIETCDVCGLFDATRSLFEARAAQAQIHLVFSAPPELTIAADRERVIQVLANLTGNALKYTPRGGTVAISARADQGGVRFTVRDTGPGIAPDAVEHVFERYWQAKARGRGSLGLGLYICKQLVEAHHGTIGVESTLGAGTTFWFELPSRAGTRGASPA